MKRLAGVGKEKGRRGYPVSRVFFLERRLEGTQGGALRESLSLLATVNRLLEVARIWMGSWFLLLSQPTISFTRLRESGRRGESLGSRLRNSVQVSMSHPQEGILGHGQWTYRLWPYLSCLIFYQILPTIQILSYPQSG